MKSLRGPLVALLAFLIGVAVSPINFYEESSVYGRMINGHGRFSVTSYRSSYFVRLSLAHYGYASPEKANEAFDEHVAEAIQVTEITPRLDQEGKIVGRRAVTKVFAEAREGQYACVFWTDGSHLHAITSSSLLHVLDFEEQHIIY